jgi:hyaluronoglucosaminidase
MPMNSIGVVEGFFGPAWSEEGRNSYAPFLKKFGGDFYIYAPKQDQYLRKGWRDPWPADYLQKLQDLKNHFQAHQIKFGVGFSPFALGEIVTERDKDLLREKLQIFNDLKIDVLGLFFDDMPTNPNLAPTQLEVLTVVKKNFKNKIIFCPTYYTFDPILEKVFGKKPDHYLEVIAEKTPSDVAIAWTGPKVISPVIDLDHLNEVSTLLKRNPYIWENFFANDGPKNCKFLKIKPYSGRDQKLLSKSEAFSFNLMNQAEISKIVFLASKFVLIDGINDLEALEKSIGTLCSRGLTSFILRHREDFFVKGLDLLPEENKTQLIKELCSFDEIMALEISDWLSGKYIVGSECLTD